MIIKGIVKKGEYYDSVTLMTAAKKLNGLPGVIDSAVVMGTKENRAILEASGLLLPEFANSLDTDLLVAVKAETDTTAESAIGGLAEVLKTLRQRSDCSVGPRPRSLDAAIKALPGANLAMISVAGRYAGGLAMKALQRGMHVMLFSDNVPIETEIELKKYAVEKNLLVMGPDCGTAIINGAPLAFANEVNRGDIGVVAAAGTGMQEVTSLISNAGCGISQAIGTGGRDVKQEAGGLMFLQGIRMLAEDPATRIILLVSKPPHPEVLAKIGAAAKGINKPVVAVFLGAAPEAISDYGLRPAQTLEEAALTAVALSRGRQHDDIHKVLRQRNKKLQALADEQAQQLKSGQKYIRGLFSGGTFCYESQVLLGGLVEEIHSNAPAGKSLQMENALQSVRHTVIDLGEDEFTVGRPHPMIDYSLRNRRILQEAGDPETAVILLDVVLGHGSNPDPLKEIVPVIGEAQGMAKENRRSLPVVCSVTGTDADPQNRAAVVKGLADCGALVMESNAAACLLAGQIAVEGKSCLDVMLKQSSQLASKKSWPGR